MRQEMTAKEMHGLSSELTKDTIIESILGELSQFNMQPKDYINLANELLDIAIHTSNEVTHKTFEKVDLDPSSKLPIKYEDISIREINLKKDKPALLEWIDNIEGKNFILSRIDDMEMATMELIENPKNIFGMVETGKTPIGIMGYLNYDEVNKKAELRKLIGNMEFRGKGYGKKATNLWLSYGISCLNLRKIYLYTFDTNLRNIRINLDMGFHLEGIFKQENIYNNEARDIIRMAYLCKE
jgi:RimJ/RimL family protein N-acetyltransferase